MNGIRAFLRFIYPPLQIALKIKDQDQDVEDYMINLVRETMDYREKNNISRKDLLQLMIQLRNAGHVKDDGVWNATVVGGNFCPSTKNKLICNPILKHFREQEADNIKRNGRTGLGILSGRFRDIVVHYVVLFV